MEEEFYASIKLVSGEELFGIVNTIEKDGKYLLLSNPVIVTPMFSQKREVNGYKVEPWLKTTTDDMFIINLSDVLTLSESSDIEMIMMYQDYLRTSDKENQNQASLSRSMGYLGTVNDTKELLEKIFKKSSEEL